MGDTLIRLRSTPGLAVDTQIENEAGLIYSQAGGAYVPMVAADWADYCVPTPEAPAGSGRYTLDFLALGSVQGSYTWIQYQRPPGGPAPGSSILGLGGAYWNGSSFDASPPASTTYDGLSVFGSVEDPAPSAKSFVVALAEGANVPTLANWLTLYLSFTTGNLAPAKRSISGYRQLTPTTALVTVGSPFPAAPASGDSFAIL